MNDAPPLKEWDKRPPKTWEEYTMPVPDTLSWLHLKGSDDTHEAFSAHVHAVMTSLLVSENKISELQIYTKEDPDLQQSIRIILIGWPHQRNQCPESVLPYWNYRD